MAQDRYKYFRVEARELVDQLGRGLLDLEKSPSSTELVSHLLRLAHTLKGAARVVKHREIADLAHEMEGAVAPFRDGRKPAPRATIDNILNLVDAVGTCVAALTESGEPSGSATKPSKPDEMFHTARVDIAEMDALLAGTTEAHVQLSALRREVDAMGRIYRLSSLLLEQLTSPGTRSEGQPVRSTLIRARSMAEELRGLLEAAERDLTGSAEQLQRELRQVREVAERLRLLPAGVLFNSLERAARDAAQSVGKRIAFTGSGSDVRLDAHVIGVVQGALVQMVRNAVAHGIEPAEERRAAGKDAEGRVAVEIVRRRTRIAFKCSDDGRGIDLEAVRRAAQRKGVPSSEAHRCGAEELLRLLLAGGISTSVAVTDVAGRGIGLDVIREAATRLGGDVSVRTETGKGTALELVVPLTLSSLDALIVEAAGQIVAVPFDAIRRTLRVAPGDIARAANGDTVLFDGKAVPLVPLARALGACLDAQTGAKALSVLIIGGSGGGLAAVSVDRLLGTENLMLRPLPDGVPADPVVAGASIDAEGNPRIVVDAESLVTLAHRMEPQAVPIETPRPPVLVVDDSLTTRMLEQSILESAGYQVDLASSGEEAIEKVRQHRYALCLVDIEMPGMDGFTFVERMRADPTLRDVPSLLVTSRSSADDRRRGEEVGARAFIVKSEFDQTALLETIRGLVR